ncbi:pyruvate dehydrogenase (acetyl-transferring) E1 component subunit alpha [Candidatus Pacearchaeota archaeon]|nr:pyruvate dehydrogenase (acetyl-transferring) E1 component subunit alpha [Candidatus Pacearchaeota archaeon]
MRKIIEKFEVPYLQILNEQGIADEKLIPSLSPAIIKRMYELMILTRTFDDKAVKLQRQGRIGTFASVKGQEACQIPSAIQMQEHDMAFPAFREHGVFITRAMPLEKLFQYWAGDERGMDIPKNVNMFPVAITVGGHLPHAVGMAMSFKFYKKEGATLVYFGDGATSEGDFHEAMNFAGVFKAPTVFICQNNQYAISVPVKEQTAAQSLAQKAIAYGFEGIQVDGNDVFAVYSAVQDALKKARNGKGPTFIECFTYRMGDHTTSDDAKKYRSENEVKKWESKDPIERLKKYMVKKKMFSDSYEKEVAQKAEQLVQDAITKFESIQPIKPEEMFDYMYDKLTPDLKEERESVKGEVA